MTSQEFHDLVARVEQYARTNRTAYRFRVGALALLGYAYVWTVLIVCLLILALLVLVLFSATGAAFVVGKLGIAVLLVIGAILRALWVKFPPPTGVPLERRDVPALFALIDELTTSLETPRFHRVLLTDDFNAAVSQRPRLGPFGWYENWLMIGLPMLEALSLEEFRAVLAHELGHLSRAHGRFGSWIYRIRMAWMRLMSQLERSHRLGYRVFDWFLKWWAPYFNAYSFVLAREQEYDADRQAAQLTSPDLMGRALVAISLQGARIQRSFWPHVARRAVDLDQPPSGVFSELRETARTALPVEDARRWLAMALNQTAATDDTHPSLTERLAALGVSAPDPTSGPSAGDACAADVLLGNARASLSDAVEQSWRDFVAQGWRRKHEADQKTQQRLAELTSKALAGPITVSEASERAQLTLQLHGPEAAVDALREVLTRDPDHAAANFTLGEILLERDDAAGVDHIERAMRRDAHAIAAGLERLWLYHESAGHVADAAEYRRRWWERIDLLRRAAPERQDVRREDRLLPHGLPDSEIERIRAVLAGLKDVVEAFIVTKEVNLLPDEPFYVLGVVHWWSERGTDNQAEEQVLVERVAQATALRGDWLVIALNRQRQWLREKMAGVPGSQLKAPVAVLQETH
ncbi:MAG TPA: M48 family metalloprotease [Gemmatimonadales bacterium]|nr:M48 family metalloprotease [Gemmatimonadales bacterium]